MKSKEQILDEAFFKPETQDWYKPILKLMETYAQQFMQVPPAPKYEFKTLYGNQSMVNEHLKKLYNEGWELAGDASTKIVEFGSVKILIPLRKKIS